MKGQAFILFVLLLSNTVVAQQRKKMPTDSIYNHIVTVHYVVLDSRVFYKRNNEVKLNYVYKKQHKMLGLLAGIGYSNYDNNALIVNAKYNVQGAFGNLGIGLYDDEGSMTIFTNINALFSYANQSISRTYVDYVWGTFDDKNTSEDFNIGAILSTGCMVKVYKHLQLIFDMSFGIKLKSHANPLNKQYTLPSNGDIDLPYFTPGMGRGSNIFMNGSIGLGYKF